MILELREGDKVIATVESIDPPQRGEVFIIGGRDYVVEGIARALDKKSDSNIFSHLFSNKVVVRCRS